MLKLKPLNNRVVVKRAKAVTTKGGILLPETAKEKPKEGEVVAVGPGVRDEEGVLRPVALSVGDHVLFSSYGGTEVDEEHIILTEDEILGVLV